ncbi:MAG: Uma2 family endonuclease [Ktedonobacteraceae bacterium]
MALRRDDTPMSVEEFFKLRESDPAHRYEYIDGEIYMMTGGSRRHSRIGSNMNRILGNLLRNRPCVVHYSDACFQVTGERYVCPDVTVSCDPRDIDDSDEENAPLQYPCLVVEVLSRSTKHVDRGIKFDLYKDHPTVQEYLVIETKSPSVQLYRRESNNRWTVYILKLDDEVELTSLGVHFPVAEIYEKTRFAK